jgi:hypothetical protein
MSDEGNVFTLSVPEAGKRYFGTERDASYALARNGHLPVVRLGRKMLVSVAVIERMLGIEPEAASEK